MELGFQVSLQQWLLNTHVNINISCDILLEHFVGFAGAADVSLNNARIYWGLADIIASASNASL